LTAGFISLDKERKLAAKNAESSKQIYRENPENQSNPPLWCISVAALPVDDVF
jgi:hypothetical protein